MFVCGAKNSLGLTLSAKTQIMDNGMITRLVGLTIFHQNVSETEALSFSDVLSQ